MHKKNALAYKAGKYTRDFPVLPFRNKKPNQTKPNTNQPTNNQQHKKPKHKTAWKLPPTLSNCFIVNIASENSKRRLRSNPLANTCEMQIKSWQEHISKRHFIVNSPLPMGHFFPVYESTMLWALRHPAWLSVHSQQGLLVQAHTAIPFPVTIQVQKSTGFSTNPAGSKLALCKDSLGISLVWCRKCDLKVLGLQHRHINQ